MTDAGLEVIAWRGGLDGHLELIDQTLLPGRLEILRIEDAADVGTAIRRLAVRGAPAIGVAAGFGLFLGVRNAAATEEGAFFRALDDTLSSLAAARPTAVNLVWAIERLRDRVGTRSGAGVPSLLATLLDEALVLQAEDRAACADMARHGAPLIRDGEGILTHCNTGALATAGCGTALGVIIEAWRQGRRFTVYADETRPLLQGARLTTWELMRAGVDVVLICDGTAAQVMREGRVGRVFVGADRIAAHGDAANKVGTYGVAVLAHAHGIPFHVVAPSTTFDLAAPDGAAIPIEERAAEEVTEPMGRRIAPEGVRVYAPAFDVTPAGLVQSIVTERGLIEPVDAANVRRVVGGP